MASGVCWTISKGKLRSTDCNQPGFIFFFKKSINCALKREAVFSNNSINHLKFYILSIYKSISTKTLENEKKLLGVFYNINNFFHYLITMSWIN